MNNGKEDQDFRAARVRRYPISGQRTGHRRVPDGRHGRQRPRVPGRGPGRYRQSARHDRGGEEGRYHQGGPVQGTTPQRQPTLRHYQQSVCGAWRTA